MPLANTPNKIGRTHGSPPNWEERDTISNFAMAVPPEAMAAVAAVEASRSAEVISERLADRAIRGAYVDKLSQAMASHQRLGKTPEGHAREPSGADAEEEVQTRADTLLRTLETSIAGNNYLPSRDPENPNKTANVFLYQFSKKDEETTTQALACSVDALVEEMQRTPHGGTSAPPPSPPLLAQTQGVSIIDVLFGTSAEVVADKKPWQTEDGTVALVTQPEEGPPSKPPFPYGPVAVLALVMFNESLASTMLIPFVGLFVAHLENVSPDEAGYSSGFLVGSFMLGQALSGKYWGQFSDAYGRKPALLCGLFLGGVIVFVFGCSTSLYMAMAVRFINGICFGNCLVAKSMIPEIIEEKDQAIGFSVVSITWSVGSMIGPTIGGFLYDPTFLDADSVFATHPALLPSVVCSSYSFAALAFVLCILNETNQHAQALPTPSAVSREVSARVKKVLSKTTSASKSGTPTSGGATHFPTTTWVEDDEELPSLVGDNLSSSCGDLQNNNNKPKKNKFGYKEAFRSPATRYAISLYMFICFCELAFLEILPLWTVASLEKGGLGLNADDVSIIVGLGSVTGLIANIVFPTLIKRFASPLKLLPAAMILWIVPTMVLPSLTHFIAFPADSISTPPSTVFVLATVVGILLPRTFGEGWGFSIVFMMTAQAAPPGAIGATTGIAMSLGAVLRCIAPLISAPIFAWSISAKRMFPLDESFSFLIASLPLLCCIPIGFALEKVTATGVSESSPMVPRTHQTEDPRQGHALEEELPCDHEIDT